MKKKRIEPSQSLREFISTDAQWSEIDEIRKKLIPEGWEHSLPVALEHLRISESYM